MKMIKCRLCCSGEGSPTSSTTEASHCCRRSASPRQEAWGPPHPIVPLAGSSDSGSCAGAQAWLSRESGNQVSGAFRL